MRSRTPAHIEPVPLCEDISNRFAELRTQTPIQKEQQPLVCHRQRLRKRAVKTSAFKRKFSIFETYILKLAIFVRIKSQSHTKPSKLGIEYRVFFGVCSKSIENDNHNSLVVHQAIALYLLFICSYPPSGFPSFETGYICDHVCQLII